MTNAELEAFQFQYDLLAGTEKLDHYSPNNQTSPQAALSQFDYQYDHNGNRTQQIGTQNGFSDKQVQNRLRLRWLESTHGHHHYRKQWRSYGCNLGNNSYWQIDSNAGTMNARGQILSQTFGQGITQTNYYKDDSGLISAIQADNGISNVVDLSVEFDAIGNLTWLKTSPSTCCTTVLTA